MCWNCAFGPGGQRTDGTLLLGHLDTVWPLGTLARMPWREEDGKLFGPGVLDMKAGVVMALEAIAAVRAVQGAAEAPGDSAPEPGRGVGSPVSRPITEAAGSRTRRGVCAGTGAGIWPTRPRARAWGTSICSGGRGCACGCRFRARALGRAGDGAAGGDGFRVYGSGAGAHGQCRGHRGRHSLQRGGGGVLWRGGCSDREGERRRTRGEALSCAANAWIKAAS